MAIVIGAASQVSFYGTCALSVNWNYSPNTQRLYCIGEWSAFSTINKPTQTLSLTVYAPSGITHNTQASNSCTDVARLSASVAPAGCDNQYGELDSITGSWYVTGFSYGKDDPQLQAQETWSLQQWVAGTGVVTPTVVIQGVSEGSRSKRLGAATGILLDSNSITEGQSGSVSAGGTGKADTLETGVCASISTTTSVVGEVGTGNVSVSLIPLYY